MSSVVTGLDDQVAFGLSLYPNAEPSLCGVDTNPVVGLQAFGADDIVDALFDVSPGGATPTAQALRNAKAVLDGLPAAGGARAVVITTDGGPQLQHQASTAPPAAAPPGPPAAAPTTPRAPRDIAAPANCVDDDGAAAAAAELNAAGYPVFVVGHPRHRRLRGRDEPPRRRRWHRPRWWHPLSMTPPPRTPSPTPSKTPPCASPPVASISWPPLPPTTSPSGIGSNVVARDTSRTNGWDLVDADTVELFGSVCAAGAAQGVTVNACR